ncbi:uncharacterized protein LOC133733212 [Rosa rugosa]|uniref:uncharacterized protein LOC133733212 n=1 Tax=Rosa rugosa TaxID=74645 RepID=UPI002B4034B6|nr:uncharacterized protein LOC133733212 [Rosa rugosa]
MRSPRSHNSTTTRQKQANPLSFGVLLKSLAISSLILAISSLILISLYIFFFDESFNYQPSSLLIRTFQKNFQATATRPHSHPSTNLSHIVIGMVGALKTLKHKTAYIKAWWRPNVSRGYLFLDRAPTSEFLPWPSSYPPFRVNEDVTRLKVYPKIANPIQVRIVRSILEIFREGDKNVRWYVMSDDDTIFVLDNLVEVLAKYDHTRYHYIGTSSEFVKSNSDFSFDMAFGGAGYILSYPLVAALSTKLDDCIERYSYSWFSDLTLHECLTDLGVILTEEKGLHQIDLRGDISGLLSSHPQSPFLSIHHLDTVDPIFPSMNRSDSINHLMKAAKVDPSRLLQQTICYHRPSNWSFSISWGYSAHIYENIIPRSTLRRPIETFSRWRNASRPFYMFNTRLPSKDPCRAPHVFYFDSIDHRVDGRKTKTVTTYSRVAPRGLVSCSSSGNHSADSITKIEVYTSPEFRLEMKGKDCCDIVHAADIHTTRVIYRSCMEGEIIA